MGCFVGKHDDECAVVHAMLSDTSVQTGNMVNTVDAFFLLAKCMLFPKVFCRGPIFGQENSLSEHHLGVFLKSNEVFMGNMVCRTTLFVVIWAETDAVVFLRCSSHDVGRFSQRCCACVSTAPFDA